MVGPRVWIPVNGLLVFLTAGGECITALIGDTCCKEDWGPFMDEILKAYKEHGRGDEAFITAFRTWLDKRNKTSDAELDDLCEGHIGLKCEGIKDSAKCVCNERTGFVPDIQHRECVNDKFSGHCSVGSRPENCKSEPCQLHPHKLFGACEGELIVEPAPKPGVFEFIPVSASHIHATPNGSSSVD